MLKPYRVSIERQFTTKQNVHAMSKHFLCSICDYERYDLVLSAEALNQHVG